jgi:hypothetical protein
VFYDRPGQIYTPEDDRIQWISGAFLRDTMTFQHFSCRILRDTVAGIFDLEKDEFNGHGIVRLSYEEKEEQFIRE